MSKLLEYRDLCHQRSLAKRWWTENPNLAEKIALIHSEISEAFEGLGECSKDDHLPHRPSVEVEIADAVIRICDLAGYLNLTLEFTWTSLPKGYEHHWALFLSNFAHLHTSQALEGLRKGDMEKVQDGLCQAVSTLKIWADKLGMDFWTVIDEKLHYNEHRPDHKPENRAKSGGKKF